MADYSQITDFSAKDALITGNPLKLILGSDFDNEFAAISAAVASKYDSDDIADVSTAQAEVSNLTLMTPARVGSWSDANAGIVGDLQGLSDPNVDRILFWDDSAGSAAFLQASTGLTISGTTLTVNNAQVDHDALSNFVANEHIDHSAVSISAGTGLTGGGTIAASRTLSLDTSSTRNTDHASVSITAGTGLSGGGTIAANRTLNVDFTGLTDNTSASDASDIIGYYDDSSGGMQRKYWYHASRALRVTKSSGFTLATGERNSVISLTGSSTHTITLPTGFTDGDWISVYLTGTGSASFAAGASATVNSIAGSTPSIAARYGVAVAMNMGSNVWVVSGSIA